MVYEFISDKLLPAKFLPYSYPWPFREARFTWLSFAEMKPIFFPRIVHREELCWAQIRKEPRDAFAYWPVRVQEKSWHLFRRTYDTMSQTVLEVGLQIQSKSTIW